MQKIGEVTREDVVDIICDVCGSSCKQDNWGYEFARLHSRWGYASTKDMEEHTCDLCETCYDKVAEFIKSIGGKVQVEEYSL
jgi:tRNA U54 and U55 pseudouridine synthase Pus10